MTLLAEAYAPRTSEVARVANLSLADWTHEYLLPRTPVVFTDATRDWKATGRWTPAFFAERYGKKPVQIDGKTWALSDFLALVGDPAPSAPVPYLRNQSIQAVFPDLVEAITPTPAYFLPNWLHGHFFPSKLDQTLRALTAMELFIGGKGTAFPNLHIDSAFTHAFLSQVYGRKELILYSPDQTPFLYPQPHKDIAQVGDVDHVDLTRFPLFAHAVPTRVIIEAGETAFIPAGWWHTARMNSGSITVSVNTANSSNWADLARDVTRHQNPLMRGPMQAYIKALGLVKSLAG